MDNKDAIEEKLDKMIELLQHLIAVELSKSGGSNAEIGKSLGIGKEKVARMLQAAKKEK